MALRVLLAENHPIFREGLVDAFERAEDIEVVAVCEAGEDAYAKIIELRPDVAVLDQRMPDLEAWQILERLDAQEGVMTKILVLSAFAETDVVARSFEAGAAGYLTKDSAREVILDAAHRVAAGEVVLGPELQGVVVGHLRTAAARARAVLSDRELQILTLVAEGLSVPRMAERLYLSQATVKTHLNHIYEKLDVSDRAAAVAEGMRRGLVR